MVFLLFLFGLRHEKPCKAVKCLKKFVMRRQKLEKSGSCLRPDVCEFELRLNLVASLLNCLCQRKSKEIPNGDNRFVSIISSLLSVLQSYLRSTRPEPPGVQNICKRHPAQRLEYQDPGCPDASTHH